MCAENTHVSRGLWWVGQVLGPRGLLLASACPAGPSRDPGTFLQYRQAQPPCWTLFLNPLCPQGQAQPARSPRPARAPDPARSCPPRGLTCAAEARAMGFSLWAGLGRPFPQPPASCPPCSASSGPFSALPGPLGTPLSLYLPAAHPLPASMSSRSWGQCPGYDVWPALSISGGLLSERK